MGPAVRVLTQKELAKRYHKRDQSVMATMTSDAIGRGYQIVLIESECLRCTPGQVNMKHLRYQVYELLDLLLSEERRDFYLFTDLREIDKGRVYCAVKDKYGKKLRNKKS